MNFPTVISRQLIRYALVSAGAFAVDVGLLWLLVKHAGMHYLVAATISFLVGGVVAYLLSIRFVFSQRRLQTRSIEGTAFVALGLAGLAINTAVMALAVGTAGAPLLVAKMASACLTFGVNFLLRKHLLFTRGQNAPAIPPGS
ncbi:MAG TPA: GtrA family protein [Steroidobacteraceae bacterium]|jgi:putative flippase GtrA|nr:GtrA family protein [Steroidobacteraceae bacterium]